MSKTDDELVDDVIPVLDAGVREMGSMGLGWASKLGEQQAVDGGRDIIILRAAGPGRGVVPIRVHVVVDGPKKHRAKT